MKTTNSIIAVLFVLLSAQIASAYYCPSTGRWLSRDPIGEPGFQKLQAATSPSGIGNSILQSAGRWVNRDSIGGRGGLNLYSYVGNKPVSKTDVLGCDETAEPDGLNVSNFRHNNYLTFHVTCPKGEFVSFVTVDYNDAAMWSAMWSLYSSSGAASGYDSYPGNLAEYTQYVQVGLSLLGGGSGFGGLQGPPDYKPNVNCDGNAVEEHAYMRTRLVGDSRGYQEWRELYDTPSPFVMEILYLQNTRLHYFCTGCCNKPKAPPHRHYPAPW